MKLTQSQRARRHGREAADKEEEPRSTWGVVSYCGRSWGGGPTCRHRSFRRVTFYQKPLVLVYEEWHLEGKGGGALGQDRRVGRPTTRGFCRKMWLSTIPVNQGADACGT